MRTGSSSRAFALTPTPRSRPPTGGGGGLDGVFCYDHLWPMGQPEPPLAPFPLLAAIARPTRALGGTLVARIGLVPDHVVVAEFDALAAIAPGR